MFSLIKNMTIRKRIVFIFLTLSTFLILLFISVFAYFEIGNAQDTYKQLSRQTANGLAFMPALEEAVSSSDHDELQGIIDRVRLQAENPVVTVVTRDGEYIIHPDENHIGITEETEQFDQTLLYGSYVTESGEGALGPAIMTTAPIYEEVDANGGERIIGAVTVEYLEESINAIIVSKLTRLVIVASIGMILCVGGALFLARSIQEDTMGIEPAVIAEMFREREAMLNAVKEGIIVIDDKQAISLINPSAKALLDSSMELRQSIQLLGLPETLFSGKPSYDEEKVYQGKTFITNCIPLYENKQIVGAICSFRDKTDMKQLQETVMQIEGYADSLRAQTHEFKNKMYVLLGLIQLEQYEEALKVIQEETADKRQAFPMLKNIKDPGAQAILLGKLAKAAEKKIALIIEEASHLDKTKIAAADMAIMLGNLLDNAMDAVLESEEQRITVMVTDVGSDIVIDIEDTGPGMTKEQTGQIFTRGYSSKGENRGYGLFHVYEAVKKYCGEMEVTSPAEGGTVFSIYLPKGEEVKK
ncbi:ATPase [Oceanobacillus oncorhynchi subsp. incaldanensis]|uniref:ATP-binding protein n=1 Tax=Oceanobacillus oncorhynchi TaxID=545501 RepID=UPI001B12B6B0|nr:sensor histidine kinase [Oceanobacillus oncorhynchi]MDM8101770.1 sensor histidine kinase [Oceanobacillus oncorhynchi]GIO20462.1 ATPase [Oceanobacillus oncorhynchi subsp. incaldanensis]